MSEQELELWNLSDASEKRRLMLQISRLKGLHEVRIKPRRRTRTLNQNAYYHVAVVSVFRDWLREQYGDPLIDSEQAHDMLKVQILGFDVKEIGGDTFDLIPRSKTLTTDEFGAYIEKASAWLEDFTGIVVIPPDIYFEKESK
jgi:hypothetical protein